MKSLFTYFFTLLLSFYFGNGASPDNLKLELVQVLFRHGSRTPIQRSLNFFTSVNRSIYEPWGIGVLTNVGKQQSYDLGKFLKRHYKDHLSADYKSDEIYARSSNEVRTETTVALVLAGLYPPTGSLIWNPSLVWSPIPFQYTQRDLDVLLRGFETPKFYKLLDEVEQSSEHKQKVKKYSDALKFIDEKMGAEASANFSTLTYLFDILYANEFINVSAPDWYTPEVRRTMIEVQEVLYDTWLPTEEMRKIGTGLTVRTLVENMNLNKTKYNPRKMYLYAVHETNIALFTRVHNIQEFRYPYYGSALIFEKWRDSTNDEVFVRLLAYMGTDDLLTLKLGNYSDFCPIKDYLDIATPSMLFDNEVDDILKNFTLDQVKSFLFNDDVVKTL